MELVLRRVNIQIGKKRPQVHHEKMKERMRAVEQAQSSPPPANPGGAGAPPNSSPGGTSFLGKGGNGNGKNGEHTPMSPGGDDWISSHPKMSPEWSAFMSQLATSTNTAPTSSENNQAGKDHATGGPGHGGPGAPGVAEGGAAPQQQHLRPPHKGKQSKDALGDRYQSGNASSSTAFVQNKGGGTIYHKGKHDWSGEHGAPFPGKGSKDFGKMGVHLAPDDPAAFAYNRTGGGAGAHHNLQAALKGVNPPPRARGRERSSSLAQGEQIRPPTASNAPGATPEQRFQVLR